MIVHNENDEDKDIKELFQQVFKPFWANVPVVSNFLSLLYFCASVPVN